MQRALAFAAGALSFSRLAPAEAESLHRSPNSHSLAPSHSAKHHAASPPLPVVTPDIPKLPYTMDGGVKVFHLIAEPVKRELMPGRMINVWGYNGVCPGPTIEATNGDRLRIIVENRLPEPTTMHWHGLEIPNLMDGMPYISQKPILPGERYPYEFTVHQDGTFFYHSHGAMQEMMGMIGMFVLYPKQAYAPAVDHDFGIVLQEWALLPNNTIPNTTNMEFNWLTFNGKAAPATTPLVVRLNSRVRIRMVNIGMDHHPIHLHGHTFAVTGTEGGRQPQSSWTTGNTVLVGVAQARDIEFVASNPGDWMVHCHLPHHMMNSMMDLLSDRPISTTPLSQKQAAEQMELMMSQEQSMNMNMDAGATEQSVAANASAVPGFPQDGFMDMPMDEVAGNAPEFMDLPPNWSAGMQGMMTLLRVMPPEKYEKYITAKRGETPTAAPPGTSHPQMGEAR
jgi:FtsP/CotA-like multicopper oxidase with cupredoxin domain